jgi:hypothetical protein
VAVVYSSVGGSEEGGLRKGGYYMINKIKMILGISLLLFIAMSPFIQIVISPVLIERTDSDSNTIDTFDSNNQSDLLQKLLSQEFPPSSEVNSSLLHENATYPEDFNVGSFLSNNENNYVEKWDPWLTKAAIHDIATKDDGDMIALAGGYLYDNEVHVYRWNYVEDRYDKVWDVGDGVFQSDVTSLAFSDVDYNNLTELIAGCADGRLYVFEQRHIYDPVTHMENQFDLVWKSPRLGRVWDVMVEDTDKDYKPDIIVGTGDTVRFYEYYHHSGYPFATDHWIEFEEVFSYTVNSPITALAASDIDYDGLPEVVIGTYSGKITLLENAGTSLLINGYPYPITNDNHYYNMWSSGNLVRRRITSMSGGNLDVDGVVEILVVAQGQGAYVLDSVKVGNDWIPQLFRLNRDYESWENDPAESYPLDNWIDYMVNSSGPEFGNVLYDNDTTGVEWFVEPLNYSDGYFVVYPYNTAMSQDENYNGYLDQETLLNGTENEAWAILDFGYHEEASGNGMYGVPDAHDLDIEIGSNFDRGDSPPPSTSDFSLELSVDGEHFYQVPAEDISIIDEISIFWDDHLHIEVDPTLNMMSSDYYQFIRVNTTVELRIDYMETLFINKPIYDALSAAVGTTVFKSDSSPTPVGFIGTVGGTILGVTWDSFEHRYKINWDSWVDERWKLSKNIFDLAVIKQSGRFPAWLDRGAIDYEIDLSTGLPGGAEVVDFAIDNFWNYENENNLEFIFSGSDDKLYAYSQVSPTATPEYDLALSSTLFDYPDPYGVHNFMGTNPHDYWSVNLVPMIPNDYEVPFSTYWLFLGHWDGTLGALDNGMHLMDDHIADVGDVDVRVYFFHDFGGGNIGFYPVTSELAFPDPATLSNSEITGQMWGIFRESTWMPKIAGGDLTGDKGTDLVITNGKVHLLESTIVRNPEAGYPLGDIQTILADNYFKEINDNSKGRHWTNPNVVDFDGDGDLDLILGFATYDEVHFGIDKKGFGMTYWENQGTREDPKWVERKKAVTNNDPNSNLRVNLYRSPAIVYDEYDWGNHYYNYNQYYPSYKTNKATRMFMFQPNFHYQDGWKVQDDLFMGRLKQFSAFYEHPTSLLAATYPEAKRLDINLLYNSYPPGYNYGFHIIESWSNEDELKQWTLAMTASDLDEDGMNEIIVGDFDNNIYVFEHMTNNTYKRAFRSFDINRSLETSLSPYAWEQFEGISGNFTRKIFQHVEKLVAGSDLDQDGLQEFIAATKDMIFIFEATRSPTGRINDDTYVLVDIIDIYEVPQLESIPHEERVINAITYAADMTADGRNELIIAVTSALLIYEITVDTTSGASSSGYNGLEKQEIFTDFYYPSNVPDFEGKYGVPGNAFKFPDHLIRNILITDLDHDGRLELVYGGSSSSNTPRPLRDGFVNILEWNDGDFFYYNGEAFKETSVYQISTVEFTEIYVLETTDHDYDGLSELIIGHEDGIDIYECTGHFQFTKQETITSNPNYPVLKPKYYSPYPSGSGDRSTGKSTVIDDGFGRDKAVVELNNGTLVVFFIYGDQYHYARSNDEGKTWEYLGNLHQILNVDTSLLIGDDEIDALVESSTGDIWIAFRSRFKLTDTVYIGGLTVTRYDISSQNWDTLINMTESGANTFSDPISPALYELSYGTSNIMGLAFTSFNRSINFGYADYGGAQPTYHPMALYDFANGSLLLDHINATAIDIVDLESGPYDYGMVIAGMINAENLTMDHDLFFTQFKTSTYGIYNFTRPSRVTHNGMNSYYPQIIREEHTNNLVIAYEEPTLALFGGLWAVWSNDDGLTWSKPYPMNYPIGIYDPTGLLFAPKALSDGSSFYLESPMFKGTVNYYRADGPALTARGGAGFHMVYTLEFAVSLGAVGRIDLTASYLTTVTNPHSNFTWYDIDRTADIAVGDSDKDGRKEIFVATEDRAVLFEFSENSETHILHQQAWISPEYENGITSVLIADGNGNNFPELVIESERGTIHSYEIINQGTIADIIYPFLEANLTLTADVNGNTVTRIRTYDVTGDGAEDIFFSTALGQIVAINGSDLSTLFVNGTPDTTEDFNADFVFINNAIGEPSRIAMSNDNNLTIWTMNTGELEGQFYSVSNSLLSLTAVELTSGGLEEIIIGTDNGTLYVFELNQDYEPVLYWQKKDTTEDIMSIIGAYSNSTDSYNVVTITRAGNVSVYAHNGTFLWYNTSSYTLWGGIALDINDDGIDDVIAGTNATFAFNGADGTQLWNTSAPTWLMSRPVLEDINDDGVLDILYGAGTPPPAAWNSDIVAGAMSGSSGEFIWTYNGGSINSLPTSYLYHLTTAYGSLNLSTMVNTLVVGSYFPGLDPQHVTILDPASGGTLGAIPAKGDVIGVGIATLSYDRPVILVGAADGTVRIHSVYREQPETEQPTSTLVTPSTNYQVYGLYHDDMLAADVDNDGIDEVIVIQDKEIIATNFSGDILWTTNTENYDLYKGPVEIVDFDGTLHLVVAYYKALIAVNIVDGKVLWEYNWEHDGYYNNGNFKIFEDLIVDNYPEIIFSRDLVYSGDPYGRLGLLNGKDGTLSDKLDSINTTDVKIAVGDFDGDNTPDDIVAVFQNITNPIGFYKYSIVEGTAAGFSLNLNTSLPTFPVRFVAAGDFKSGFSGDEFILFEDFAYLGTILGIDLSGLFPDVGIPFRYTGAALNLAGNLFISPVIGHTYEVNVFDWTNDNIDDMLIRTHRNRYYAVNGSTMKITSNIPLAALADSDTATVMGNFDKDATTDELAVVAHDKILMFSEIATEAKVSWFSQFPDDMVLDMVIGDFDDDTVDDIAVMSYLGQVYVFHSEKDFVDIPIIAIGEDTQVDQSKIVADVSSMISIFSVTIGFSMIAITVVFALIKRRYRY